MGSSQKALDFDDSAEAAAKSNGHGANGHAHPEKANGSAARSGGEAAVGDHDEPPADDADRPATKRRATAESMATKQRDISVSEFFAKNRHLLGFDNPRKALLTTVKEAVDNSLDACEEAGIVPEIWVTIEATGNNRFKVSVQDNGPGIVKKQIPLIFGKLLYGSKFHRLRMSRGQQGIGISAAGMYGMLTTGKPVRIISKLSPKKPAHYFELQIDTKRNMPEIINGKGEGEDIAAGEKGHQQMQKQGIDWVSHYPAAEGKEPQEVKSGTRVTIELEGRFIGGRGSVGEYLEETAIANPHVTLHYKDAEGNEVSYQRSTRDLPPEPKEIKPHPYGVELGRLVTMLKDTTAGTTSAFLTESFSRVSSSVAKKICDAAKITTRSNPRRIGRQEADALYQAIQNTRISPPATDCLVPIGEQLILKGLHQVVPGEFYCAATRPPAVYRGNPFLIEVGLAYGGVSSAQKVSLEALTELLGETDARTLRQFLMNTFDGIGSEAADKIMTEAQMGTRQSPAKLKKEEIGQLHAAMRNVNLSEGQSMQVLRYANRVPLQFQPAACAITQAVIANNWRSYGLSQSRGNLPQGPVTIMVHMASVWVPFTSESKEAIAGYPEIQKELRLGLQAVGRKLGMFLNRKIKVRQEGERRSIFLRYLGEVAEAVGVIEEYDEKKKTALYEKLLHVAKRKTVEADTRLDDRGKKIEAAEEDFGENVLIVEQPDTPHP
ncbi:MAG: DNA topoisomerase VI subunit B [Pirellulaceae bacterium]|nr:DNA topoisomerase VI subunit B [Pirellulaceae bacterium]